MQENAYVYFLVLVPVLGILAQWIAWRLHLPSIIILLTFGLVLGLWIHPDQVLAEAVGGDESAGPSLLFPIVSLSVAVILFEGGMTLKWDELRGGGRTVFSLITIGAAVTMLLTALTMRLTLQFSWQTSFLLGAVLMVTGPTVIGPLLRLIRPSRAVGSVLQWEGILIDPVGAISAVVVFELIAHSADATPDMIRNVGLTMILGIGLGWLTATGLVLSLRRYWIPDYLHGACFLAATLGVFWLSNNVVEESGLVTVTVLGIVLANQKRVSVEHVLEFKEHLGVLLIGCLFILLGARLRLSELGELGWRCIPMLVLLIGVVRPISVWISTIGSSLHWKERLFIGLIAPRGIVAAAVASVFGLRLIDILKAESPDSPMLREAELLVSVTFVVILGTVVFCGLFASTIAKRLGISDTNAQGIFIVGADEWVRKLAKSLSKLKVRVLLVDTNHRNVTAARLDGLEAICGNVLSEHLTHDLNFSGIGRFLALTPNDEVNTLAIHEYSGHFGREKSYQLVPSGKATGRFQKLPEHLQGRRLFGNDMTHARINELVAQGWEFKTTQITAEFSFHKFLEQYAYRPIVLFTWTSERQLLVATTESSIRPSSGSVTLALVPSPTTDSTLADVEESEKKTSKVQNAS